MIANVRRRAAWADGSVMGADPRWADAGGGDGRRWPSEAGRAATEEVEAVVVGPEAGRRGDGRHRRRERLLDLIVGGHVGHRAARGADQVVVVLGEVLGELEPGELVGPR